MIIREFIRRTHFIISSAFICSVTPSFCAICANELPLSVRTKCDRSTQLLNKELKQRDQIRAVITPVPNQERYTVELIIDDDAGNLLTLQMAVPDRQQATEFAQRFQKHPEALYHAVLSVLLDESER